MIDASIFFHPGTRLVLADGSEKFMFARPHVFEERDLSTCDAKLSFFPINVAGYPLHSPNPIGCDFTLEQESGIGARFLVDGAAHSGATCRG
jgi:hypothetical protein